MPWLRRRFSCFRDNEAVATAMNWPTPQTPVLQEDTESDSQNSQSAELLLPHQQRYDCPTGPVFGQAEGIFVEAIQMHILSFVIHYPPPPRDEYGEEYYPLKRGLRADRRDVAKSISNCALVSRAWHHLISELVQQYNFTSFAGSSTANMDPHLGEFLTPTDLAKLKFLVAGINLKNIRREFWHECKERWGHIKTYHQNALGAIVKQNADGKHEFIDLVEKKYRHFLLIKCIEARALQREEEEDQDANVFKVITDAEEKKKNSNIWLEKCQPNQLVEIFWNAHRQHAYQYAHDCDTLMKGNYRQMVAMMHETHFMLDLLDNHVSSSSPLPILRVQGSDYQSKIDVLFRFEKSIAPKSNIFLKRRIFPKQGFGGMLNTTWK